MGEKALARIAKRAAAHLEQGERVRAAVAVDGRSGGVDLSQSSGWAKAAYLLAPLPAGSSLLFGDNPERWHVILTDRNLYILRAEGFSSKLTGLVRKYPIDSVRVKAEGLVLRFAEMKLRLRWGSERDADKFAALASMPRRT